MPKVEKGSVLAHTDIDFRKNSRELNTLLKKMATTQNSLEQTALKNKEHITQKWIICKKVCKVKCNVYLRFYI